MGDGTEHHHIEHAMQSITTCTNLFLNIVSLHESLKDNLQISNTLYVAINLAVVETRQSLDSSKQDEEPRDEHGRSIKQVVLASGSKALKNDGLFFGMTMTDDADIAEIDPVTNL